MQDLQETWVQSLHQEDPLKEGMATHSSYSCLENPMDRGAWWATVHGVAKSQTQLSTSILPYSFEKINTSTKIFILVSNKELFKMANMTYSD